MAPGRNETLKVMKGRRNHGGGKLEPRGRHQVSVERDRSGWGGREETNRRTHMQRCITHGRRQVW